ncbi:hypothetical protein DENSPDRAFT_863071 [Dentipellis sp. KUC8613]|nr:hypothetical protein DENSPDRAFT_863071 [Dentipellis sp. KUC8613]
MDNLQQYQPLSHALHPPVVRSPQYAYDTSGQDYNANGTRREEEEEEEEDVVEGELDAHNGPQETSPQQQSSENRTATGPAASTSQTSEHADPTLGTASQPQPPPAQPDPDSPLNKRRPGRPKGSRNRKPRESANKTQHNFHSYTTPPTIAPNVPGLTPQNQQYYEFQWRILNLCSEFYGAAEELVKATPSVVIAQSYQMGPASKVDPLNMLNEAKRICDQLLQNPSQLVGQPPPSVYPAISYGQPASAPSSSTPTGSGTPAPAVITNPQSFVMSLGMPGASHTTPMPGMPYPTMYAPPARYPTAGYYQYPGYYPTMPAQSSSAPASVPASYGGNNTGATTSTINMNPTNLSSSSGAWTEEETERLKKMAEQSRSSGTTTEIDWDWVVAQWGNTRTRHQILLKATSLGLKESTTRGTKRRRETDPANPNEGNSPRTTAPSAPSASASAPAAPVEASPAQSHTTASTTSTQPSPATQPTAVKPVSTNTSTTTTTHRQMSNTNTMPAQTQSQAQPQMQAPTQTQAQVQPQPQPQTSNMPWPMPTVAASTSPVITASQTDRTRNDYYRPPASSKPPSAQGQIHQTTSHQYMYQPNGNTRGDGRR